MTRTFATVVSRSAVTNEPEEKAQSGAGAPPDGARP
jgi:hypothetical protein